jgi:hypothetical protein
LNKTGELKEKLNVFLEQNERGNQVTIETIKKRMIEEIIKAAKEEGLIIESEDKLVCKKHPDSKFKHVTSFLEFANVDLYMCVECKADKNVKFRFDCTFAYRCPTCGIVYGEMKKEIYRSSEESWRALAGREGMHYYCFICGELRGAHYWGFS